jgi:hypothetical protein
MSTLVAGMDAAKSMGGRWNGASLLAGRNGSWPGETWPSLLPQRQQGWGGAAAVSGFKISPAGESAGL